MITINEAKTTTDADIINKVFRYKKISYKIALAANPNISKDIMTSLLNLKDRSVSIALANNSCILPDIALELFNSGDFYTLEALSKNPVCPPDILDKMKDIDIFYLYLAENPSTRFSTLEHIISAKKDSEYCYDILSDTLQKRADVKCIEISRNIKKM